jgi:hypothetical protein
MRASRCSFLTTFVTRRSHSGERGEPQCEGNRLQQLKIMLVPDVGTFFSCFEPLSDQLRPH